MSISDRKLEKLMLALANNSFLVIYTVELFLLHATLDLYLLCI